MHKYFIFILSLAFLVSCGQKSEIDAIKAEKTTKKASLFIPLSDQALPTYDSQTENMDIFFAGGLARMMMNAGAYLGAGRINLSLTQKLPSLESEYLNGVRVKRLFFYIEPKKDKNRGQAWWKRVFNGQGDITFDFIDKFVMQLSSTSDVQDSWYPSDPIIKNLSKEGFAPLEKLFMKKSSREIFEASADINKPIVFMKYDRSEKSKYIKQSKTGIIYIVKSLRPAKTRAYLTENPEFKDFFTNIHILNQTLIVELKKDPVFEEKFQLLLLQDEELMNDFEITNVEQCSELTCLDLEVPETNILPLLNKDKGIKLDAFMNASKAPDSFQLKGFFELELSIDLPF